MNKYYEIDPAETAFFISRGLFLHMKGGKGTIASMEKMKSHFFDIQIFSQHKCEIFETSSFFLQLKRAKQWTNTRTLGFYLRKWIR